MNTEMKQLAANFSDFQSSLQEKDSRNNELSQEISSLQSQFSSCKAQISSLQTQLTLSHTASDNFSAKVLKLEETLSEKDVSLTETTEKLLKMVNSLKASESETKDVREELKSLHIQLDRTESERKELSADSDRLKVSLDDLKHSFSELEKENDNVITESNARYKEKCDEAYQLDFKLTALRNEHSEVSLNYEKLKESHSFLESKEEALNVHVDELKGTVKDYEISTKSKSDELLELNSRLSEVINEKELLQKSHVSLEEQLGVTSSCVMDLNTRIEKKDEMLLGLNKKIQKLEAEIAKPCTMCLNYESKLNKSYMQIQVRRHFWNVKDVLHFKILYNHCTTSNTLI